MAFNKIKLNVAGTSYVINSQDSEEHVLSLANTLDEDMRRILEKSPSASITAAAVICALTYLDKLDNKIMKNNLHNHEFHYKLKNQ